MSYLFFFLTVVTPEDSPTIPTYDLIDQIILYFYIFECVVKAIGIGIEKYWEDDWNKFDFAMVMISIASDLLYEVLEVLRGAKTAKAGKLLRLTKINRVFKMFRAFRTIKFVNFLMIGADAFA